MQKNTFNILTFDGGGLKGALSIGLFERIEKEVLDVIKNTNLIGGTSTGSLIALGLAYGLSPQQIKDFYSIEKAGYIFDKSYSEAIRPKYNNHNLKEVLLSIFPETLKLKDLGKLVVIPSFYLGDKDNSWKPIFYNNLPNSPTENERVVDVAMASSAAPVFFPTYKNHTDGGIVATDPSLACVIYSMGEEIGVDINDLRVLSFGTGYTFNSIKEDTQYWGAVDWVTKKNPDFPIISITMEANASNSEFFVDKLLKNNYKKINPKMDKDISMDDVKELKYLINLSSTYNLKEDIKWVEEKWN